MASIDDYCRRRIKPSAFLAARRSRSNKARNRRDKDSAPAQGGVSSLCNGLLTTSAGSVPLLRRGVYYSPLLWLPGFKDEKGKRNGNLGSRTGSLTVFILDHCGFLPMFLGQPIYVLGPLHLMRQVSTPVRILSRR